MSCDSSGDELDRLVVASDSPSHAWCVYLVEINVLYIVPLVSAVAHLQPFRQCLYFSFIYYFRPAGNAGESDCRIHHFVGGIWGSAKTN